ncbi:hypothetical protein FXV91_01280 [Methanosarcina sp. DH2]|jgi:hypothetical protein|nr:hypothetical protein [Methanosarcina sp. DH2]MCC4768876.1 hypothetical protein [Methanosarcina sp. DH2]
MTGKNMKHYKRKKAFHGSKDKRKRGRWRQGQLNIQNALKSPGFSIH